MPTISYELVTQLNASTVYSNPGVPAVDSTWIAVGATPLPSKINQTGASRLFKTQLPWVHTTQSTNHVHIVVTAPKYKPQTVASQLKAWSTRNLKSNHPNRERFWTEGASKRWINQESELATAVEYTLEAQDRKGV